MTSLVADIGLVSCKTSRVPDLLGWDHDIDIFSRRISIAEGNDWNIDVGGFLDSLSIGTWVGDDDEAGFLERAGDVVREVTRSEATSGWRGASVRSELENSTLAVWASTDACNVGWIIDRNDDACRENNLLPL